MRLAGLRRALVALAAMTGLAVRAVELDPRAGVLGPRAPHARRAHPRHTPKVAAEPDGIAQPEARGGLVLAQCEVDAPQLLAQPPPVRAVERGARAAEEALDAGERCRLRPAAAQQSGEPRD